MRLENLKIVNIDDTDAIRKFIEISLEEQDSVFYNASTAQQGIQLIKNHQPDLIILDLGLPDIDGLTLLPMIKKISDAKVIILTARRESHFKDSAFEKGADAYITKPFMMDQLLRSIKNL